MRNKKNLVPFEKIHQRWMKDPEYKEEYEKLEPEFQVARQVIEARLQKKMTQEQLARKIGTGQAAISRVERASVRSSIAFLQRIAKALDMRLELHFSPR